MKYMSLYVVARCFGSYLATFHDSTSLGGMTRYRVTRDLLAWLAGWVRASEAQGVKALDLMDKQYEKRLTQIKQREAA